MATSTFPPPSFFDYKRKGRMGDSRNKQAYTMPQYGPEDASPNMLGQNGDTVTVSCGGWPIWFVFRWSAPLRVVSVALWSAAPHRKCCQLATKFGRVGRRAIATIAQKCLPMVDKIVPSQ
jgi:hypothetical protein